jgi:hypothetical protein
MYASSSSSSAHYSPLLDIGLSSFSPSDSIFGKSHPAPASRPAQIVTPPNLRASYTMFTKTRFLLENSFTPEVVGSTAEMTSPLSLQHPDTVCYIGDFSSLFTWWLYVCMYALWQTNRTILSKLKTKHKRKQPTRTEQNNERYSSFLPSKDVVKSV